MCVSLGAQLRLSSSFYQCLGLTGLNFMVSTFEGFLNDAVVGLTNEATK